MTVLKQYPLPKRALKIPCNLKILLRIILQGFSKTDSSNLLPIHDSILVPLIDFKNQEIREDQRLSASMEPCEIFRLSSTFNPKLLPDYEVPHVVAIGSGISYPKIAGSIPPHIGFGGSGGTSQSAPIVAGGIASLMQAFPNDLKFQPELVKAMLIASAVNTDSRIDYSDNQLAGNLQGTTPSGRPRFGPNPWDGLDGGGHVNFENAFRVMSGDETTAEGFFSGNVLTTVFNNPNTPFATFFIPSGKEIWSVKTSDTDPTPKVNIFRRRHLRIVLTWQSEVVPTPTTPFQEVRIGDFDLHLFNARTNELLWIANAMEGNIEVIDFLPYIDKNDPGVCSNPTYDPECALRDGFKIELIPVAPPFGGLIPRIRVAAAWSWPENRFYPPSDVCPPTIIKGNNIP